MTYYFLYGEDTYRSRQKLNSIRNKYINSGMGDTNLSTLEAPNFDYNELARQFSAVPFLAQKRLILVKNLLIFGGRGIQKQVADNLDNIFSNAVAVFYEEGVPDKRLILFKKLNKPRQSQNFVPLSGIKLHHWIAEEGRGREMQIDNQAVAMLADRVGNDLWRMSNELDKLAAYAQNPTPKDIDILISPKIEARIFDFTDAILQKDHFKALKILSDLDKNSESPFYVFSIITGQFRNMILVKDYLEGSNSSNRPNYYVISRDLSIHPFVVKKITGQKGFSLSESKEIYRKILDFDIKIKTGKIKIETSLGLLTVDLCRRG